MPGLIITASPGWTVVTSGPAVSTTPTPSDPRMWGNWRSPGRPRTTNKSRWLSAAARMATRTSRPPSKAGEPGAGTSATSIRSRPPVSRMRHARMMPRLSDTMTGASRAEWLRAERVSDAGCFTCHLASPRVPDGPAGACRGAKRVPFRDRRSARTARGGECAAAHPIDAGAALHEPQGSARARGARASVDAVVPGPAQRVEEERIGGDRLRAVLWPECEQHDAPLAHSYHGERTLPFEGGAAVQPAAEQQRIGVAESGHPRHLARVRAGLELEGGPPLDPGDRFAGHAVRNGVARVDIDRDDRARRVVLAGRERGEGVSDRQVELLEGKLRCLVQGDQRAARLAEFPERGDRAPAAAAGELRRHAAGLPAPHQALRPLTGEQHHIQTSGDPARLDIRVVQDRVRNGVMVEAPARSSY